MAAAVEPRLGHQTLIQGCQRDEEQQRSGRAGAALWVDQNFHQTTVSIIMQPPSSRRTTRKWVR
jgi:hypothetical protein